MAAGSLRRSFDGILPSRAKLKTGMGQRNRLLAGRAGLGFFFGILASAAVAAGRAPTTTELVVWRSGVGLPAARKGYGALIADGVLKVPCSPL